MPIARFMRFPASRRRTADLGSPIVVQTPPSSTCAQTSERIRTSQVEPPPAGTQASNRTLVRNRIELASEQLGRHTGSRAKIDAVTTCALAGLMRNSTEAAA